MILRMMPESVSDHWDELKVHIAKSLPEGERSDETLNGILAGLLRNQIQMWLSYDSQDNNKVNAVALFTQIEDPFKGEKNLLVYTINRLTEMDHETTLRMYLEGIEGVRKLMKAGGYKQLVGYIDEENDNLLRRAKQFGAKLRWHWAIDMTGD